MNYDEARREVVAALQAERVADGGPGAYDVDAIVGEAYVDRRGTYRMIGSTTTFWSTVDRHKRGESK